MKRKSQAYIFVSPSGEKYLIKKDQTVLDVALENKLPLGNSCGGMGTCTTCLVIVESDLSQLPARNEIEDENAIDRNFKANERLSCQLLAYDGLRIRIPNKKPR